MKKTISVAEREQLVLGEPEMGWWKRYREAQGNQMPGIGEMEEATNALSAIFGPEMPVVKSLVWSKSVIVSSKLAAEAEIWALKGWFEDMLLDYTPRQRLNGPDGYMESDKDYILANADICVRFLDMVTEMLEVEK
jgi:hypothetical protein